jgi:hypothetical protein
MVNKLEKVFNVSINFYKLIFKDITRETRTNT